MKPTGFSFLFFLFALLLLSGCAALPARAPDEVARAWAMRQQALAPITNWELRGRIALRSRDEGMQASLHWVRERERQRISLVGPLGSGQVRLTQDAGGAELRDTEKNVRRAPTARQLLVETTGWDVPFDDMDWWVRGLPAPGAKAEQELDEDGRLKTLTQFGWEVEFLEYGRYGAYELPSKLFARRRENAPGIGLNHVTTEVRVVIERWVLPGE
ncbi:MAG: lipoprotein insertase outer membrane protein LolB [Pseudomonadota bacterium]